jgi:PAS domain S-box-containing protein
MEVTIDGVLVVDETGKIISYNHRFIEIWGIPPDVIASRSDERALQSVLDNLVNPEEFLTRVKYLYMHREEKSHEEIRLNDNRMLDRYSAPMIGNDGRYYGRVWYFRDITDRKKAEQEIARIADEWEVTFNAASDGICLIDANQKLIRCNTRMGEILGGMKNEDLAGKPCWAVVHKTTGPIPECPFVSAKKTLTRTRVEVPAGDLWFEVTADPVIDSSGMFAGAVHIMRDITDRKRAEEALRESETRYRNLFKSSHDAMMTLEPPSWKFTTGNPATVQMFLARDEAEFTSREPWSLSPELQPDGRDSGDKAKEMIETAMRDGTNFFEWTHKRLNGEDFPATVLLSKVELAGKVFLQATVRDITEQKRAEEALRQANKQLNLLSSITRHDILNQLMALKGYLELSHEMIDNPTTLLGYIQKEEKAANTIEAQITFTKNYQALGVTAPVWQNVNASINKAIAGLPMRDVHVEVDPKNPDVFADPLFEKVFYNLIDNALRYGGDQMKTIRFSSQESDGRLIQVCEDDGVGISTEDKKKLFTRGFGKNTGLGLFLSREILAITGITIAENGIPGKGARFEITVPKGAYRFKGTGGN